MSINEAIEMIEMFADDDGQVLFSRVKNVLKRVEMPDTICPFVQDRTFTKAEPIKWYRTYKDTGTPPYPGSITTSEGPTIHYPVDPYGGPTFYC